MSTESTPPVQLGVPTPAPVVPVLATPATQAQPVAQPVAQPTTEAGAAPQERALPAVQPAPLNPVANLAIAPAVAPVGAAAVVQPPAPIAVQGVPGDRTVLERQRSTVDQAARLQYPQQLDKDTP